MCLTLLRRRSLSYRNQSIDLPSKSLDWFLYDNGLRVEKVNDRDINIGFNRTKLPLDFQKKDLIRVKQHSQFSKDSKNFIISLLSKLFKRIPLGSVMVRCSSICNPANLVVNELDSSKRKMK